MSHFSVDVAQECQFNSSILIREVNFINARYGNFHSIFLSVCMNFTYDPYEFSIGMDMNMNDNSIFQREVSGKNPPPLCLPVPTEAIIPIPLGFEMCVKMFNIFTPGYNLHMCMDIMAQIQSTPIMVRSLDYVIQI